MNKIFDGFYYVGVNDRVTHKFESLWPIPLGVSYNSYLVKGENKIALIDGVELSEIDTLNENIHEAIGKTAPDYLIINHMEPDHSGAIKILHNLYPNMVIVGNSKTLDMVKGYYGITENTLKVADNDTLDLGGLTLTFKLTPMVHWPETMMTYVNEWKMLFSGDAFGCFGAINGGILDSDTDVEMYIPEMYRYYSNIVGKYGAFVQKAIAKFADTKIDYICPTHGPIWHEARERVVGIYDRLSKYEAETGVTIVYGSMYGHTEKMADTIARQLAKRGIKNIRIHNAANTDLSYILSDIFKYKGLIIGAPTYSNSLFPPIEALLYAIANREVKNRVVASFGNFTWGGQAVKRINAAFEQTKLAAPDVISVEAKMNPDEAAHNNCIALADAVADNLLGQDGTSN